MTISSETNSVSYTGNGVTTAFSYPYAFHAAADLVVIETIIATGAQTTKTLTTHYTVSGTADALGHYPNGGTVTAVAAPASTVTWRIYRDPDITQSVDLVENDPLPAETLEAALDRTAMISQRLSERMDRTLRQPDGDTAAITTIPAKASRASKFLTFDADGNPTASAGSADSLTVSAFVATLLDDADAATARATLGISSTGLDITGLAALTVPAVDDELPIYDLSAAANRKITPANLLKAITVLTAETAPATDDELAIYDTSAATADKITLANMLKVVNALTEDATPDAAADFVLTYDTSASAVKKAKPSNLGTAGISAFTVQAFTGSGTWTRPSGVKYVRVVCVGGGGGGGGADGTGCGGGGGGGGYAEKTIDVTALASAAVGIGAAGAAGSSGGGGSAGGAGGDTTFNSTTVVGKGGSGGQGVSTTSAAGAGGVTGTGDVPIAGRAGAAGNTTTSPTVANSTEGGASALSYGHGGRPVASGAGNPGVGYGGGGGGANGAAAGGAGTAGICIVFEYK